MSLNWATKVCGLHVIAKAYVNKPVLKPFFNANSLLGERN
jgi:hypothetical protein